MRALIPASLIALSLATPTFAAPDPSYELPAGNTLERFQLAQTTLSIAPKPLLSLKDPWDATSLSGGGPLILGVFACVMSGSGNLLVALGTELLAPLVLSTGYLYAEAPWWHGPLVVAGGYAVELLGAIVGGAVAQRTGSGSYSGIGGLVIGPAVALIGYSAWAGYDAYQTAERYNQRLLTSSPRPIDGAATP